MAANATKTTTEAQALANTNRTETETEWAMRLTGAWGDPNERTTVVR